MVDEIDRLRAERGELMVVLRELAEELSAELEARYPSRNTYKDEQRRYRRDMGPVERAAALLERLEPRPSIGNARSGGVREG